MKENSEPNNPEPVQFPILCIGSTPAVALSSQAVAPATKPYRVGLYNFARTDVESTHKWAFLLTVKQDTVKTSNRILDTLWEALSG